tara:strand:- start:5590 stop:6135 length:546 start_codon:yes stop_codon:yes gene_type:complete
MEIKLLPIDKVEIDLLYKWQNDVQIKYPIMGFRFPIQKKVIEEWIQKISSDNGKSSCLYGIFLENKAVGLVNIHDIDYVSRNAKFGIYIGEKKQHYKGIGFLASTLALDFAFNGIGLHRIDLEVLKTNNNAIKLYKKIGFSIEGEKRDAYSYDGDFINVYIMSLLKNEFKIDKKNLKNRLV